MDKYLFKDGKEIKKYNGLVWNVIGTTPATKEAFDTHGMTDLSIIDNEAIQGLVSDTVELLCWTDEVGETAFRTANLTAVPHPQLLLPKEDIEVGEIESVKVESTIVGVGDIKIIASINSGVSWQGKAPVDLTDLSEIKFNGFTPEEFNALTKEELTVLFPNGTARFAFYLEQESSTDVVDVNSLAINEMQYTMTPSVSDLSVIYELLKAEKPTLYVSRNDGEDWLEVKEDELVDLSNQPEGSQLRVKAVLENGQELHGLSYSWI